MDNSTKVGDGSPKSAQPSGLKRLLGSKTFRIALTVVVAGLAIYAMSREISMKELTQAFQQANPLWIILAAIAAGLTWVGAGVPLKAFAKLSVSWSDAVLVQMASSFIAVAAPAGMGPVALHLRYLTKRGVTGAAAGAIIVLIEISQFVASTSMLIVALLVTRTDPHVQFPLKKTLIVIAAVIVVALLTLAIPAVRNWLVEKTAGWITETKQGLVRAWQNPRELALALGGVFLQTGSYALALVLCLKAVGHPISIFMGIIVTLLASTIGSAVPVPGGIGSMEAAFTAALRIIGVPTAAALSAVVLFRVLTFYIQIPIGWIGWEIMQRRKLL